MTTQSLPSPSTTANAKKRKASMNGHPDKSLVLAPVDAARVDLAGKRIAVVGGTDGIGRALARLAASRGAEVVVVGRTFRDEGTKGISFVRADLSSMKEAKRVGESLDADLDVVVFTTGIMAAKTRQVSSEGIELDLAVSTLSRLAILRALAPRLEAAAARRAAAPVRVFVMGFPGAGNLADVDDLNGERSYGAMKQHMNTVAVNEAIVLDTRARHPQVEVFGLNPGLVKSNIRSNFLGEGSLAHNIVETLIGVLMPSPDAFAARVLPLFVAPELRGRSGAMFGKKATAILPTDGLDDAHVASAIAASEALIARATA